MKVLLHHLYEYKKGLRHLVLHTMPAESRLEAEKKLMQQEIDFFIRTVSPSKINVFFGDRECVEVIREIGDKRLSDFTPEEDFVLGTMLGYDRLQQCKRYLQQKKNERSFLISTLRKGVGVVA